jgi:hypothetical protein
MGNFLDFYGDKLGQFKAMPDNGLGVFFGGVSRVVGMFLGQRLGKAWLRVIGA